MDYFAFSNDLYVHLCSINTLAPNSKSSWIDSGGCFYYQVSAQVWIHSWSLSQRQMNWSGGDDGDECSFNDKVAYIEDTHCITNPHQEKQ